MSSTYILSLPSYPCFSLTDSSSSLQLSFRSLVEDVDRRQAERDAAAAASSADGVRRRPTRSHDRERSEADGLEIPNLPVIGDALRELLVLE